jgi:hypothetical protein
MPEGLSKRLITGEIWNTIEDRRWLKEFLDQLPKILGQIDFAISTTVDEGISKTAWQFGPIVDAMLESSFDPNGVAVPRSVLTTKSRSIYEFNWLQAGGVRDYKIVLGPGNGVPSHHIIIDRSDIIEFIQKKVASGGSIVDVEVSGYRPYGMEGLKIQCGMWRADGDKLEFWPESLHIGTWVYLEQTLPQVVIP